MSVGGRYADAVITRATSALPERTLLMHSVVVALILSLIAIVAGLIVGSRIIVFDGVYGIVGLSLTWIALRASRASQSGPSDRYPFGRESLTPFAIVLQGVAMLGTLLLAAVDAVLVIIDGGSDVAPISVVVYGAFSAVVSALFTAHLFRRAGGSELVTVEALQWRAGAVRNAVMVAGAAVAILVATTTSGDLVRFLDPVLVLVAVAMLAPIPVRFLRSGVYELLEGAPPAEVQQRVALIVDELRARHGLAEPIVRMSKLGRKLYVQVDIVVEPGSWTIEGQDVVRRELLDALAELDYDLWASLDLTTDPSLAE